jgi:hypothetical protein
MLLTIGTECRHCDIGWYSIDGLSASTCVPCPEGETTSGVGTALKCSLCDIDYYSPSGAGPCSRCPDGKGTNGLKGQTLCSPLVTPVPTVSPPTPGPSIALDRGFPIHVPDLGDQQTGKADRKAG